MEPEGDDDSSARKAYTRSTRGRKPPGFRDARERCSSPKLNFGRIVSAAGIRRRRSPARSLVGRGTWRINVSECSQTESKVSLSLSLPLCPLRPPHVHYAARNFGMLAAGGIRILTTDSNSSSVKCTGSNSSDKPDRISGRDLPLYPSPPLFLPLRNGARFRSQRTSISEISCRVRLPAGKQYTEITEIHGTLSY